MDDETRIGGPGRGFPVTRWSAVQAARSEDPEERREGLQHLVTAYWKPVYKYLRARWRRSNEDAKDLTQELFTRLVQGGLLERYEPSRARLRTYLRSCLDNLVRNQDRTARAIKRGGEAVILSLDFEGAEEELSLGGGGHPGDPERYFRQEWVRGLFAQGVESLRRECEARDKTVHFRLFELYDLAEEEVTYRDLAERFELKVTDVTNHLAWARRTLRGLLLEQLARVTGSEMELRREARELLGMELP